MGEIGYGGGLRQAKLGSSGRLCTVHDLPSAGKAAQSTTGEVPPLQEATDTHPRSVDSCELMIVQCLPPVH